MATAPNFVAKPLTRDCKTRVLGWSDNGDRIVIAKEVLAPCAVTVPICATANVVALNPHSNFETILIKASYLREKKLDDPELVNWNTETGILYIWNRSSQIGGIGTLVAMRGPSEETPWSIESYGATVLSDGRMINVERKTTDLDKTGFNWEWQYQFIRDGKATAKYVALPTSGAGEQGKISRDGKYVVWEHTKSSAKVTTLYIATESDPKSWKYTLPEGFDGAIETVWTPSDSILVKAYKKTRRGTVLLRLWLLNPGSKVATKLFEASDPLPRNPYADFTRYSVVRLPNGELKVVHPPIVLARWSQ